MVRRETKRRLRIERYRTDIARLTKVRRLGNKEGWTPQRKSLIIHLGGVYNVASPPEEYFPDKNALGEISIYARWSDLIMQEITRRARRDRIDHPLPLPPRRSS